MSTNYHSPIVPGESNSPSTWNTRFSGLDSGIVSARDAIEQLVIAGGTSDAETIAARTAINYKAGSPPASLSAALALAAQNIINAKAYGATGDGSTDDTTAVAAALSAASFSGGGVVKLPLGTYAVTSLTIPANTILEGQGAGSVIKITSTSGSAITVSDNARLQNVKILYGGQSASHRALVYATGDNVILSGLSVECTFEANAVTSNLVSGLRMDASLQNFIISDCILKGPGHQNPFYSTADRMGWGIHITANLTDGCSGHISNVTSIGWTDGIKVSCTELDLSINNCILADNGNDGIDCYYSGRGHIIINGCIFRDNLDHVGDFKVNGTTPGDGDPYALTFVNNICHDHTNAAGGEGSVGFSGNSRMLIANNQFYNMTKCLNISAGTSGKIVGNRITNVAWYGISIADVEDGDHPLLVANNLLIDCGTAQGSGTRDGGIKLENTTNVVVTDNIIYWTAGTITTWSNVFAILIVSNSALKCIITGNYTNRQGAIFGGGSNWINNYIYGNVNLHTESEGALRWDNGVDRLQVYTGSAWQSLAYSDVAQTWTTIQTFQTGLRSGSISIGDDGAGTLTGIPTRGILAISTGSAADEAALVAYRAESTPFCTTMTGSNTNGVTTDVTGTTGSDGFTTVSAQSTGVVKIENRQGGGRTYVYTVLG